MKKVRKVVKKRVRSESSTPPPVKAPGLRGGDCAVRAINSRVMRNTLDSVLHPMGVEEFRREHFAKKKVAVIKGGGAERIRWMVQRYFDDLDVDQMLLKSPSEAINIWMTTKSGENTSFKSTVATAQECYKCNAALYFRAPVDFEETFLALVGEGLGMGHSIFYPDGDLRAEVETFVSPKGHVTEWHYDFMENITIQLKGQKTWKLKDSGIAAPSRAMATHFEEHGSPLLANQTVLAKLQNPDFTPNPPTSDFQIVTLQPGDVLYHPAGVWHRVETDEDSISINLSYMNKTWGELMMEAVSHVTRTDPEFLERFSVPSGVAEDAWAVMDRKLNLLKTKLSHVTGRDILPRSMLHGADCIKREKGLVRTVVINGKGEVDGGGFTFDPALRVLGADVEVVRNPLGLLADIEGCSGWLAPRAMVEYSKKAKKAALQAETRSCHSSDSESHSSSPPSSPCTGPCCPGTAAPPKKYTVILTTTEEGDSLVKITLQAPADCSATLDKIAKHGGEGAIKLTGLGASERAAVAVLLWVGLLKEA